ncbi:hypothetical protein [Streptomyces sp. AS02]|uniref:hypothetical protein n=1 Tax=Streptomyces sp. AS02 TaxID=2938946 RepID=UPI002022280E|nr:hypothetical protein [Streptomyces sp. AS02]MCL8015904.1 hypothetical protein [Streptomyces sp. AS02]
MRAIRKTMKLCALAVAVAAALTTTACEPGESDAKADGKTSPSASAPSKPDADSGGANTSGANTGGSGSGRTTDPDTTGTPDPEKTGSSKTGGSGGVDGKYEYADRQTPPQGSVCDNGGQGPYGVIESVTFGGEAPNTTVGLVLGNYDCGKEGPVFKPTSATGAAMDVLLDDSHLKVVVGGTLASDLGTKTPDANTFVKQLAQMQDNGELGGPKSPEFYFRIDGESDDVNTMPDDESHIIYLYQIIDGD